jgi:uncharacterized SAM-binding protein YcdF (DUF218 family)
VNYGFELTSGLVLPAVLVLLIVPNFALIALLVVALAAAMAVVALAGLVIASPYLLVRSLQRQLAARHRSTVRTVPTAGAVPRPARMLPRSRVVALEHPTPARVSS